MTLIEFIKSLVSQDSRLGDLAKDKMSDKNLLMIRRKNVRLDI